MKCVFHRNTLIYRQDPVAHKNLTIFRSLDSNPPIVLALLLSRLSRPKGRDEHKVSWCRLKEAQSGVVDYNAMDRGASFSGTTTTSDSLLLEIAE